MEKYGESSPATRKNDSISKKDIQSAIKKLSEFEKLFEEVAQNQQELKSWMFLKNIDLAMALDAIVYRAKIDNKLCDVKMITSNVEYGFSQLKCTHFDCSEKAIMCHKRNNDVPAELYCEDHSNLVDPLSENRIYFEAELKTDRSILMSLERLLVVVQEQTEFIKSESSNKDVTEYIKIKAKLEEEMENLKNTLNDMTVNAKQIVAKKTITNKPPQYEPLSFVKSDYKKCKQSIFEILRLIFEANLKDEIESKLKTILNWSAGIEKYKEESKSSLICSVPDKIYGREFELCKIPTQTLKKVRELERRVQSLAKIAINYQKVRAYYFSLND